MVKAKESLPLKPGFDRYLAPVEWGEAVPFFGGEETLTDLMTVLPPVRVVTVEQVAPLFVVMVPLVT
jgi:hypothetical protein